MSASRATQGTSTTSTRSRSGGRRCRPRYGLTAATPVENPYCSCRLTRVSAAPRSRRRPSSLGTSAACTPPWLVRAVGGAPTQRPFCPPTNAMFTGNQTPYFAANHRHVAANQRQFTANQRHLLPPTSAICYRRPTPHCAADQRHVNSSPPTGEQGLSPGDMPDPAKFAQFAASVDFTGGMNLPPTWNYPRTRWP